MNNLEAICGEMVKINDEIQVLKQRYEILDEERRRLRQVVLPKCSCCGTHQNPKAMWVATREDLDNFRDTEGYSGPVIGEDYCGC